MQENPVLTDYDAVLPTVAVADFCLLRNGEDTPGQNLSWDTQQLTTLTASTGTPIIHRRSRETGSAKPGHPRLRKASNPTRYSE